MTGTLPVAVVPLPLAVAVAVPVPVALRVTATVHPGGEEGERKEEGRERSYGGVTTTVCSWGANPRDNNGSGGKSLSIWRFSFG